MLSVPNLYGKWQGKTAYFDISGLGWFRAVFGLAIQVQAPYCQRDGGSKVDGVGHLGLSVTPMTRKQRILTLSLVFLFALSVMPFSGSAIAQQSGQELESNLMNDGVVGEACFGDKYETDEDMNEGNTITDEEILLILNPLRS